jgi:hypothetical protein
MHSVQASQLSLEVQVPAQTSAPTLYHNHKGALARVRVWDQFHWLTNLPAFSPCDLCNQSSRSQLMQPEAADAGLLASL